MPALLDINHRQGYSETYDFEVQDGDHATVDPTNWTAIVFRVKKSLQDADASAVLTLTLAAGDISVVTVDSTKKVRVAVDADGLDTASLTLGEYQYTLTGTNETSKPKFIDKGKFNLYAE
jgi:hypothetical protein